MDNLLHQDVQLYINVNNIDYYSISFFHFMLYGESTCCLCGLQQLCGKPIPLNMQYYYCLMLNRCKEMHPIVVPGFGTRS